MTSSNISRNSLSERSYHLITNIVNDLQNNPNFCSWEFFADRLMYLDRGGLALHMIRDGNLFQTYGFFPNANGDIEKITIVGQRLYNECEAIGKSHMAFGLPIDVISFDEEENRIELHVSQTLFETGVNKEFVEYLLEGNNYPSEGEIMFDSSDHIRFHNGVNVSGHNYGCHRRLVVEKNIQAGEGYTVTMYNLDGLHPIWRNNMQMSPKQMKITNVSGNVVELRGYGWDSLGISFAAYGVTLCIEEGRIAQATINMFDRNVSILYLE